MINKKNKVLSAMLSVCMTFTAVPAVYAAGSADGSDVNGHWAETALTEFINDGYLNGDGNGNYKPDGTMTRAQFSAIINRILKYTEESSDISKYNDVSASAWYRSDLAKALAASYLSGTSGSTMSPEASITREQAFTIIARVLKLDTSAADDSALSKYGDAADVSDWAEASTIALVKAGYVSGDNNGKLNPKKPLTRAEGVTILSRSKSALEANKVVTKGVYTDGTYTGTGAGYGGTMTLKVTVKDGKISAIDIVSDSETPSYLERAKTLLQKIIDNNGTSGINAVSGATRSSNGIFDAVNACLSQAQGGKDTSTTGSTGGGGSHKSNATKPTDDNTGTISLPDGVYEGTAEGYSTAGVTAKVTFKDGKITDIELVNNGETASYYNKALNNNAGTSGKTVVQQIKDKNSTDNIDTVSGATYSSWAIIQAVKNAISKGAEQAAVTYEVASWSELTNALAKATSGDTIKLSADITDGGKGAAASASEKVEGSDVDVVSSATASISKNITLDGNGHTISAYDGKVISVTTDKEGNVTATSVIDPNFCFEVTAADDITIKNLTIDGASYSAKLGGAMYLETGAGLTLDTVTFKNCKAGSKGAGNGGGAIYVEPHRGSAPTLTATNCTFENNIVNDGTTGHGGAICGYNANIVLENCTFSGNKSGHGGAVAAAGSTNITVKNCTFEANNDGYYGGDDIYIYDGYTFYKKTMVADSAVGYSISGNTHKGTETDWKDYNVVIGRVLGEVSDTTNAGTAENPKTGTYSGSGNSSFLAGHDLTFAVTDYDRENAPVSSADASQYKTVTMNIPYADFYAAELEGNNVAVDAVTSATGNKWKATDGLAKGSYNDGGKSAAGGQGGQILGVKMPVVVPADYTSDATLTENDAYYTADYDGTPEYYKIMNIAGDGTRSFSKTYGVETDLDANMSFTASSRYGDFQINTSGLPSGMTVYGVVVSAADKTVSDDGKTSYTNAVDYGMRHLENIWRSASEVSWSCGFSTKEVHGNTLSYAHYASMMGKYITEMKLITSSGIYTVSAGDDGIYVPVKFNGSAAVAGADENAGTTAVTVTGLPDDYQPVYTVTGPSGEVAEGMSCDGTAITWSGKAAIGTYTLKITDGASKYDSLSASFVITTSAQAAKFDASALRLVAADGVDADTFAAYLDSISSVNVKAEGDAAGKDYSATGRGSVAVFNDAGFLDLNAAVSSRGSSTPVFTVKAGAKYTVAVTATGYAEPLVCEVTIPDTIYAYASISYSEYWAAEGVYGADDASSSDVQDSRGEYDKGGFDAVTRATTNHGLHRGSFQQTATIYAYDSEGNQKVFNLHHYSEDGKTMYFTDGTSAAFNRGTLTVSSRNGSTTYTMTNPKTEKVEPGYVITGIKYVPVAVSAADYAEFCSKYTVTQNGEEMEGGYGEGKLKAYTYTAYVNADTNGLKAVTKKGSSWSFGARQTGSESGLLDESQSSCSSQLVVKDYSGSYGEFLRADMTEDYAELGAAMQTVRWDYYGDGDKVLASYGTKFAADNWMHKSMGIQLGLTESARCQLPANYDGTGKWVVTIYALGYEDYSYTIDVTAANLPSKVEKMTEDQKTQLTSLKDQAYALLKAYVNEDGTVKEGATVPDSLGTLLEHYKEAVTMLADADATQPDAAELITELPGLIEAAKSATTSSEDAETAEAQDAEAPADTAEAAEATPAAEEA